MNADHPPTPLAVARLRRALGERGLAQTVVNRGYRSAWARAVEVAR